MHKLLRDLESSTSNSTASYTYYRKALRQAYAFSLDRVNVLGNDEDYGHKGCVNALSWSLNGDLLISGGDDTTLRLWRQDSSDCSTPYPYKEASVIDTGHTRNIFNAQLLPCSSRIATVAGDRQVRVFDVERALTTPGGGKGLEFSERETCIRVFRCHKGRTKRIVTEESSDIFLTVAEDGSVRQHDLRTPHQCDRLRQNCPPPLVVLPHDLSALALSPLSPWLFVVAGESQYGYLFDRRQVGRTILAEWGVPCTEEQYVTCVRRFGRPNSDTGPSGVEHITGARMSQTNGHEVLLSYNADAVYLYSIRDEPQEGQARPPSMLSPNNSKKKTELSPRKMSSAAKATDEGEDSSTPGSRSSTDCAESLSTLTSSIPPYVSGSDLEVDEDAIDGDDEDDDGNDEDEDDDDFEDDTVFGSPTELDEKFRSPIIMPRRQFIGHCNVETVKDVNFLGPEDEFVVSGSDDGNFFIWDKNTGRIHGIYEGDQAVVNVIEGHPRLPLVACSGIDTTVKLFAPTEKPALYSRTHNSESIVNRNMAQSRMSAKAQSSGFARLLWQYRLAFLREDIEGE